MLLVNCGINFPKLVYKLRYTRTVANQTAAFAITQTTLYVPVVTLSTHDNANLP